MPLPRPDARRAYRASAERPSKTAMLGFECKSNGMFDYAELAGSEAGHAASLTSSGR